MLVGMSVGMSVARELGGQGKEPRHRGVTRLMKEVRMRARERVMQLTRVWASGWLATMTLKLVSALPESGYLSAGDVGGLA